MCPIHLEQDFHIIILHLLIKCHVLFGFTITHFTYRLALCLTFEGTTFFLHSILRFLGLWNCSLFFFKVIFMHYLSDWSDGFQRDEATEPYPVNSIWDSLQHQWEHADLRPDWSWENKHRYALCSAWNSPEHSTRSNQKGWVQGTNLMKFNLGIKSIKNIINCPEFLYSSAPPPHVHPPWLEVAFPWAHWFLRPFSVWLVTVQLKIS